MLGVVFIMALIDAKKEAKVLFQNAEALGSIVNNDPKIYKKLWEDSLIKQKEFWQGAFDEKALHEVLKSLITGCP